MNKKAFQRSFLAAFTRLVGVGLGAGAGSLIYQLVGGGVSGWGVAIILALVSFILILVAEYQREVIEYEDKK